MRNSKMWLVIAAGALVGALVLKDSFAQTKATPAQAPASTRVAVVDIVKVFANYQRAKDLEMKMTEGRRTLKAEDDKRQKQLDSLDQELKELNPNSEEYNRRMDEMARLAADRESWIKFQEAKESRERYRLTEEMYKDMTAAIADVAKQQNFQIVLSSDESTAESKPDIFRKIDRKKVMYAEASLDITDLVLTRLNETYKAPGK